MPSTAASRTKRQIHVLRAKRVYDVISQFGGETGWDRIFLLNATKYTERILKQFRLLQSEPDGTFVPPKKAFWLPERVWWSVRRANFSYDIRTTNSREVTAAHQKVVDLLEHAMYDPVGTGKRERSEDRSEEDIDTVSNDYTDEEDPAMHHASSFGLSGSNASSVQTNGKSGLTRSAKRRKAEHGQELQDDSLGSKSQTDSKASTTISSASLGAGSIKPDY